jgi:hypothetical protein
VRRVCCIVLFLLICVGSAAEAHFQQPMPAPVSRIIATSQRQIDANPKDAEAHYILGRAHYLAWSLKSETLPAYSVGDVLEGKFEVAPPWMIEQQRNLWGKQRGTYTGLITLEEARRRVRERLKIDPDAPQDAQTRVQITNEISKELAALAKSNWKPPQPGRQQLDDHALAGLKALREAVRLDPENAVYLMCLASLQDEVSGRAAVLRIRPDGKPIEQGQPLEAEALVRQWREAAANGFAKAYALAVPVDRNRQEMPVAGLNALVSYSAIASYLRLVGKPYPDEGKMQPATAPAVGGDEAFMTAMLADLKKPVRGSTRSSNKRSFLTEVNNIWSWSTRARRRSSFPIGEASGNWRCHNFRPVRVSYPLVIYRNFPTFSIRLGAI